MVPVLLIEELAPVGAFPLILRRRGYSTEQITSTGQESLSLTTQSKPEIVILRAGTRLIRTLELIPELREKWPSAAILVLAETAREVDALSVLSAGADEFFPIPIALQEFLLKLDRIAARRSGFALTYAGVSLSIHERRLAAAGRNATLTPLETEILATLIRAEGEPVPRQALGEAVGQPGSMRTIDSHVSHLRTKLRRAQVPITVYAVYGAGYRVAEVG
jgi:two-component system response regulator BaeR